MIKLLVFIYRTTTMKKTPEKFRDWTEKEIKIEF
jgi:hypothetical protein